MGNDHRGADKGCSRKQDSVFFGVLKQHFFYVEISISFLFEGIFAHLQETPSASCDLSSLLLTKSTQSNFGFPSWLSLMTNCIALWHYVTH